MLVSCELGLLPCRVAFLPFGVGDLEHDGRYDVCGLLSSLCVCVSLVQGWWWCRFARGLASFLTSRLSASWSPAVTSCRLYQDYYYVLTTWQGHGWERKL